MVQIIEENVQPSFASQFAKQFGAGAGQGFGQRLSQIPDILSQKKRLQSEDEALKRMGIDLSGASDPEIRKAAVTQLLKQKEDKNLEKSNVFRSLKDTVGKLRDLSSKSGIGLLGRFSPSGEARYNRGQFQTLKSELLNYYKSLFPRGITQQEFKKFEQEYIPNENDTEERIRGKLDAYENLVQNKLESFGEEKPQNTEKKSGKVSFNLKNPEHKAKAQQLYKKLKDKEKVREALKREFEGLDV